MARSRHRKKDSKTGKGTREKELRVSPEEFTLYVAKYQNLLFKYIFNIVHDYYLTQDLAQEVFAKVYRSLERYDPRYPFSTWLLKIAHNHSIDHLRRRRLDTVSYDAESNGRPVVREGRLPTAKAADHQVERNHIKDRIEEAIFSLSVEYSTVIVLRYLDGRKLEEIAYIQKIPLGTVKSRINRARQILQARLSDLDKP